VVTDNIGNTVCGYPTRFDGMIINLGKWWWWRDRKGWWRVESECRRSRKRRCIMELGGRCPCYRGYGCSVPGRSGQRSLKHESVASIRNNFGD